jgi:hypothetical protein
VVFGRRARSLVVARGTAATMPRAPGAEGADQALVGEAVERLREVRFLAD